MTAAEYLNERQRLYRRYMYLVDIIHERESMMLDARRRAAGEDTSNAALDRLVAQRERGASDVDFDEGYAKRAHDVVARHMSDEGRQILSRFDLAVGELETANFSATTLPVPGESNAFVLAFTRGLSGLTYEVARHLFATVGVTAGDEQAAPTLTLKEAARLLHARLRRFIHLGVPYGDEFPISPTQIRAASTVTTYAERFVYCHEIGHVLLGHLASASVVEVTDDYLLPMAATLQPFEQEYEADTFAWHLLGGTLIRTPTDWQLRLAGMTLFFETVHLLENANDSVVAETHPPARERIVALHALASAEAQRLGAPMEAAFSTARFVSERLASLVALMPALPSLPWMSCSIRRQRRHHRTTGASSTRS